MLNIILVVILGAVGIGLLLLELFLLPGFGIAGIGGILALVASVGLAHMVSASAGIITLGAEAIIALVATIIFFRGKSIEKMALNTTIDSKVEMAKPGNRMEEELKNKETENNK